jgi:uncharacterized membrane protein
MEQKTQKVNWIFLLTGIFACLFFRLIPFRAPNIEPILATQIPFAKAYGTFIGFFFGVSSIVLYDIVTNTLGVWTFITATTYGLVGILITHFFNKRSMSQKNVVSFAVIGTLFYDALTGLSIGPLFFHQPLAVAFVGQIPFTALHLLGNIMFSVLISCVLYRFLIRPQQSKQNIPEIYLLPKPIII